jgi:hypothetical protein
MEAVMHIAEIKLPLRAYRQAVTLQDEVDSLTDILGDRNLGLVVKTFEQLVLFLCNVDCRRDFPARHADEHT